MQKLLDGCIGTVRVSGKPDNDFFLIPRKS